MSQEIRRILENDQVLGRTLRSLPRIPTPTGLTERLRVVASRERQRALEHKNWRTQIHTWLGRAQLLIENSMRPLAVPFAGGVFSAVTLFSVWVVPAYPALAHQGDDVPTQLSTEAKVKRLTDIGTSAGDVVVDVTLDSNGQLVDYEIVSGPVSSDEKARVNLANLLVFSEFVPATSFGKPKAGKIRLCVSSSRIDVKG